MLIKPSSLGDIVHALPVLHGLRTRYPSAAIHWLVAKSFAPILASQPQIDELVIFDRRRYGRMVRSPSAAVEFYRFARQLQRRGYDLVIDLQGLFRSGFLARMTGARVRLGFRNAREGAPLFYSHRLDVQDADAHAVDRNLTVLAALGIDAAPTMNLALHEGTRQDAATLIAARRDADRLVVIAPGARWETKVWPADRFVALIDDLSADRKVRCLLLGSADEAESCRRIADECVADVDVLAGRTSLVQMAGVIDRADCVVCHDSGTVHVATALGRPLVCLVGPTNPQRTGPYGRMDDVLRVPLECSPCYLRRMAQCRFDHRCMRELSVRDVSAAVRARLGSIVERPKPVKASSP